MRLHRELGITQKSAWFMLHRLRKAAENGQSVFSGPVEVDETYIGGRRANLSNAERKRLADAGRGPVGKAAIVGMKDRESNAVRAKVVAHADKATLQRFVTEHTEPEATIYTERPKPTRGCPERTRQSSTASPSMSGGKPPPTAWRAFGRS